MATSNRRIQVTVDDELAAALDLVDAAPASRSRLVRDLALRGARAIEEDRRRAHEATALLLDIATGHRDHDFDAVTAVAAARADRLP